MMSLMAITSTFAQQVQGTRIPLEVNNGGVEGGGGNPYGGDTSRPRSPQHPPVVSLDVNTLYFYYIGYDFTLQLLDDDENVVYSTFVWGGTPSVMLPSNLEGEYELRLVTEDRYLYGWINL
jgi:hypothetical protein